MLVGRGLEGRSNAVVLMTEPYTYEGKITGMQKGIRCVYALCPLIVELLLILLVLLLLSAITL